MRGLFYETMGFYASLGVIIIIYIVLSLTYLELMSSNYLMKLLGVTGTNVLTRVFGIILAALVVQNIINGINVIVHQLIINH